MKRELIRLMPVVKHTIWGGERIPLEFNCKEAGRDIGELWAVSAHSNGDCLVTGGSYDGYTLSQLWNEKGELFGRSGESESFPLLVKIIDACDRLSIQVHPDDEYAGEHENGSLGKTECWYILDCKEDSELILGHNAGSKEELNKLIDGEDWDSLLRRVKVHKGDFLQIDPGTIHAIGSGILILETQQSSDITYRVYDYDRVTNGEKRQLHIEESKAVIEAPCPSLEDCLIPYDSQEKVINKITTIYSGKYYCVYRLIVDGDATVMQDKSFLNLTVTEGSGEIDGGPVKQGDSLIVPFDYGKVSFKGSMTIIASSPAL